MDSLIRSCAAATATFLSLPAVGLEATPGAPALRGSWVAEQFEVSSEVQAPLDLVALGGAMWLTIDVEDRYIITMRAPEAASLDTSSGSWKWTAESGFEIRPDGADAAVPLSVVVTGDTILLAGPIELDLDGDGSDDPATFEATLSREADKLAEGDGIPGSWVRSGQRIRTYQLARPPSGEASALLLVFHGSGDSGRGIRGFADLDRSSEGSDLMIAYPDGVGGQWADGCECTSANSPADDLAFVETLIGQLSASFGVDTDRVYAAGYSRGGMFAQRLGCQLSHRIAAVASVAAGIPVGLASVCSPGRGVPTQLFYGDADRGFEGSTTLLGALETLEHWATLNACVGQVVSPLPDLEADGTTVSRRSYASCAPGAETELFVVKGGGHTWPGSPGPWPPSFGLVSRDISAAELILAFLARHTMR